MSGQVCGLGHVIAGTVPVKATGLFRSDSAALE
jgi:hypothetical protein